EVEILDVDNTKVRTQQIARLKKLRAERDASKVESALKALSEAAQSGKGNLLALAITAAECRCSLGEISTALEKVYGRYKAQIKSIAGVYSKEIKMDKDFLNARKLADTFAEKD